MRKIFCFIVLLIFCATSLCYAANISYGTSVASSGGGGGSSSTTVEVSGSSVNIIGGDQPAGYTGVSVYPVVIGGIAESTVPTAVDDGDVVNPWLNTYGQRVDVGTNVSQGTIDTSPVARAPVTSNAEKLIDTTLDNIPLTYDSSVFFIGDKSKVSIYKLSVLSATDSATSSDLYVLVSPDNSTFATTYFFSDGGEDAPVYSITHSLAPGGTYTTQASQIYLPYGTSSQYMKLREVGTGTDAAGDQVVTDVWVEWSKN